MVGRLRFRKKPDTLSYSSISPRLLAQIRARFLELTRSKKGRAVRRLPLSRGCWIASDNPYVLFSGAQPVGVDTTPSDDIQLRKMDMPNLTNVAGESHPK